MPAFTSYIGATPETKKIAEYIVTHITDLGRIPEGVAEWVHSHIKYMSDPKQFGEEEYWSTPTETIASGKEDCDSMAGLAAAILNSMPEIPDYGRPEDAHVVVGIHWPSFLATIPPPPLPPVGEFHAWVGTKWLGVPWVVDPTNDIAAPQFSPVGFAYMPLFRIYEDKLALGPL